MTIPLSGCVWTFIPVFVFVLCESFPRLKKRKKKNQGLQLTWLPALPEHQPPTPDFSPEARPPGPRTSWSDHTLHTGGEECQGIVLHPRATRQLGQCGWEHIWGSSRKGVLWQTQTTYTLTHTLVLPTTCPPDLSPVLMLASLQTLFNFPEPQLPHL